MGMYGPGTDLLEQSRTRGPIPGRPGAKSEAAFQRAAGRAMKEQAPPAQERVPTPLTSPANSEDDGISEDQCRQIEKAKRMAARSAPRAAAPPRAPTDQPTGAKAPIPTKGQAKGQESPETKVSKPMVDHQPMVTRSQAKKGRGAGGFRGVAGSGQSGAVCGSSSPARKPGS
jgi:hypothetical protein